MLVKIVKMKISILLLFVNAFLCFGDETFQCMKGTKYSVDGDEKNDEINLDTCLADEQNCMIAEGSFVEGGSQEEC